jgi:Major capsid protein Gp23
MAEQMLTEKWDDVLSDSRFSSIEDQDRLKVTARLLENQEANLSEATNETGNSDQWNPILVSMVRRIAPRLIAYDLMGVQALTLPTGLIFCMKARYANDPAKPQNDKSLPEAMGIDEVNAGYSGDGTANAAVVNSFAGGAAYTRGKAMTTKAGEESTNWAAMGVTIERTTVTTDTRQLRADYSQEIAEDMKRVHGLNVDSELVNIISNEITAEINREMMDKLYISAKQGAQWAATPGSIDLTADVGGRWSAERFRGLQFAIDRDANRIALETRRGKGNKLVVSADVASALAFAGIMTYAPAIQAQTNLKVDPSGATFVGTMGNYSVYVDPYAQGDGYLVGYKGSEATDAGIFYCPYIPLSLSRAVDPKTFQMALGFKTRYGWAVNPFVSATNQFVAGANPYYRAAAITDLF